jgi:hypothetical protein
MLGQAQFFLIFLLVKTPETISLILWTPSRNYFNSFTLRAHFAVIFKFGLIKKKKFKYPINQHKNLLQKPSFSY